MRKIFRAPGGAREEGIAAGASSGAALHAALAIAGRKDAVGRNIVLIWPIDRLTT
jgi:cysteine synthase